ncbi:Hydrogenase isoenzymes nickel incorporation protein HypB [Azoarcus sp. Aa7]|nr:Hydrogenase isoenzymes nickel incorporation protein HypB [Azoarcus sp. Aa7]
MCTVCGCGGAGASIGGAGWSKAARAKGGATRAWKTVTPAHDHEHSHGPAPEAAAAGEDTHLHAGHRHLHFGVGPAHAHAPGLTQSQMVKIERDILGKNDASAEANRKWLAARGIFALNLVSSPGSGKTALLVRTLTELAGRVPAAVIEGDQQTEFDAERIRATGVPALQINTGKGCHLDADMVARSLAQLELADDSLLLIENVGNLVCPAAFDLGEAHKVAILSVTEGEDKPLKYPDMFAAAALMLLNKVDLLPHLTFDVERAIGYARRVNPAIEVIRTSSTSGEGIDEWLAWLERGMAKARGARAAAMQRDLSARKPDAVRAEPVDALPAPLDELAANGPVR